MAVLPTDYTDATTPTGATTELPATTARGLNAITTQINTNTTAIATKADSSGGTLTSPKINAVYDASTNLKAAEFEARASAVNNVRLSARASTGPAFIEAVGADTDVHLGLASQGAGRFIWFQNSGSMEWLIDGNATNIGCNILPKGTGRLQVNGVDVPTVSSTDDLTGKRATLAAGSTTVAPLKFTSGTALTTPAAGALEFDGTTFAGTIDTTSGRALSPMDQMFRLAADGSAIGATIADYFGANSAFPYVASAVYEIVWYLFYTKTTAGTVTYTITSTTTPTSLSAWYCQTPIAGIGTAGTAQTAALSRSTSATAALPATGSLTTAVQHQAEVHAIYEAGTAGNLRLRVTESAGSVTPLRGSFYRVRRLPAGNVGTFVA